VEECKQQFLGRIGSPQTPLGAIRTRTTAAAPVSATARVSSARVYRARGPPSPPPGLSALPALPVLPVPPAPPAHLAVSSQTAQTSHAASVPVFFAPTLPSHIPPRPSLFAPPSNAVPSMPAFLHALIPPASIPQPLPFSPALFQAPLPPQPWLRTTIHNPAADVTAVDPLEEESSNSENCS
jgi:hypothetical protein